MTPQARAGEQELLSRVRIGDHAAFELLVRKYAANLTKLTVAMGCSRDDGEDIVQQVFVNLWERRASWRSETIRAYLFAAVRNTALNFHRRARIRNKYVESVYRIVLTDPVVELPADLGADAEHDSKALIQDGLSTLTNRQAFALLLRYEHRLKYEEIASALGISPSGSEQLVARAISALRGAAGLARKCVKPGEIRG